MKMGGKVLYYRDNIWSLYTDYSSLSSSDAFMSGMGVFKEHLGDFNSNNSKLSWERRSFLLETLHFIAVTISVCLYECKCSEHGL